MAKLQKANKVVNVDDSLVSQYLAEGYDLITEEGEVVEHATGGRTISIAEHNAVLTELAEAKKALDEVADLKSDIKVLEEENEKLDKLVKQFRSQQGAKQQNSNNR